MKDPEQTVDYMYCKLSSLFPHVSAYSQQQLWIGCSLYSLRVKIKTACKDRCSLYSLRVKIAYLGIKSKLANHRFVNILAFESAIQVLNGLATNMRNPAPSVKIICLRCVTNKTNFLTQWIAIDSLGVGHCCDLTINAEWWVQAWIIARRWEQNQAGDSSSSLLQS